MGHESLRVPLPLVSRYACVAYWRQSRVLEVLRQIKMTEQLKHIPVVVLATSTTAQDTVMAYASNANAYVVKPLDFAEFKRLTDEMGYFWLQWNRTL